ncbi:hypothetical protein BC829DRAFT_382927 [Chytridium lagenaria]|nr:hypothetical protein BC829DRAFT_382927 [Chytridium lagenaria]
MAIKFILLVSRQGKIRLTKWFTSDWTSKEKGKAVKEVSQTVLSRRTKMCNVLEYRVLDKWFLNVCELDIIFNFQQAYTIMELQESSKRACINTLKRIEETEKQETAGI